MDFWATVNALERGIIQLKMANISNMPFRGTLLVLMD